MAFSGGPLKNSEKSAYNLVCLAMATSLIGLVATMGFCIFMWFIFPLPWTHPRVRHGTLFNLLLYNFAVPVHAPGGGYFVLAALLLSVALYRRHRYGSHVSARLLWVTALVSLLPLLSVVVWSACWLLA